MQINCVWEHNGNDTLVFFENYPGAYVRGPSLQAALCKVEQELSSYGRWSGADITLPADIHIASEKSSQLRICDADSDIIFDSEREELSISEYETYKSLALKSAADFWELYQSIPDKDVGAGPLRKTFYGTVPRTAVEMYEHTKNVNSYYFAEIDVEADNRGTILECRQKGFAALEKYPDFLNKGVILGSYGEEWSLRKVLRRFLWHDRIHARAMYRMAKRAFPDGGIPDVFCFE